MKTSITLFLLIFSIIGFNANILWQNELAIRHGVNIEWFRTAAETTDGGAIYVWSDTKLGERDLYAQKVDAQGNLVWGAPLMIDGKPDRQEDPVITKTSDGNYVIAWIDFSIDLDGDVYAQKINNAGQLLWQTGGVPVCAVPGVQISLNIEPDATGGAYIVWVDSRNPGLDLYGQRLSGDGAAQWALHGIAIANSSTGDEEQNTMWADGTGGLIIAYALNIGGAEDLFVKRFLADGSMAWPQVLALSMADGNQSKVKMAPISNGEFVFVWQDARNIQSDIYAQKISLAGQVLWQDPFIVFSDNSAPLPAPQDNPRIVQTSDNAVVIVWEDKRLDNQNPDLFAQKINATGQKLWNPDGLPVSTAEFFQRQVRMASDGNGGAYMVWEDARNGNAPNIDVYAQHFNAAGQELWTTGGLAICTMPNEQSGGSVKVANNNVFFSWMDMRNGSVGLYYQVLNATGAPLLAANGVEVFWGLSGDAIKDQYVVAARQNDVVVVWHDTRYANMGSQIFYQIVNLDGSIDFVDNGKSVTNLTGSDQLTPQVVVLPDDSFAIVWEDKRYDDSKIFAQLLDPNGNRMWGDMGLELTTVTPLGQYDPFVSYDNGAIYVGWSNYDFIAGTFYLHVWGQKMVNGERQWGPDGIRISALPTAQLNNECRILGMSKRYFIWKRADPDDFTISSLWVKLVNPDGTSAPGWPNQGVPVSTYVNSDRVQLLPQFKPTAQGLAIIWQDMRGDFLKSLYGQHISSNGAYILDPLGVQMTNSNHEQEMHSMVVGNEGITFVWSENQTGDPDIAISRFSHSGQPQWGAFGFYLSPNQNSQESPWLARFHNSGLVAAWSEFPGEESDIFYRYINPDGSMVGNGSQILCNAEKQQYLPVILPMNNNEAVVIWSDGRASGKTEILGLYAQKISNETVSNNDSVTPPVHSFLLAQNFPNPFNPSTTISFSVQDNSQPFELKIYNVKGQLVKTLYRGHLTQGQHALVWDGLDDQSRLVGSGVYMYRLSSGNREEMRKMVMIK